MNSFARSVCLVGASLIVLGSVGSAQAGAIDTRFFGHWTGSATVTDYTAGTPKTMDRDVELDIRRVGVNSFEVLNTQMTTSSEKETRISVEPIGVTAVHQVFEPIGATNRWAAQKDCSDISKRKGCGWAHLEGGTLVIDVLTVDAKGSQTIMSTKRQLTDDGIKVSFHRITDGELMRFVEGTLKNVTRDKVS